MAKNRKLSRVEESVEDPKVPPVEEEKSEEPGPTVLLATTQIGEPAAFGIRRMRGVMFFPEGHTMKRIETDPTKPVIVTLSQ